MSPVDPGAALREIADHLPEIRKELKGLREGAGRSRKWIRRLTVAVAVIAIVALITVGWTAHQQATINAKSAAIDALVHQNAADAARDARNAHDLCVKLTRSRAMILGVWKHVLSERPGDAAWLLKVEAAESLGACPKAVPAGS